MFCQRVRHNWVTELILILILNLPSSLSVASWIKSLLCLNTSSQAYWPTVQWAEWAWTQFSSVTQSCPTLWDPMDYSMPGCAVHHQLPVLAQTHVHQVSDAIQPSHLQLFPSPLALNLSQYQGLFQWVSSLYQMATVLELQLQHQSFQWIFRTAFL